MEYTPTRSLPGRLNFYSGPVQFFIRVNPVVNLKREIRNFQRGGLTADRFFYLYLIFKSKHMRKHISNIILFLLIMAMIMAGCKNVNEIEQKGWAIKADPNMSTLCIKRNGLDTIAFQVRLNLKQENEMVSLSGWSINKENGTLMIDTKVPEQTSWAFNISQAGIDVMCSDENGLITGMALAGDKRIPARVKSQDNGIMYTQMGFVSASNIYNLFDMPTDIMIRFTEESKLTRNKYDNRFMDIRIPLTAGNEFSVVEEYYTNIIGLSKYQETSFKPVYKHIPNRFEKAPTGWSSYYCYYLAPTEKDLIEETNALSEKLRPYGLDYVQLDAAYTRGAEANWLEWNKEMYPKGGKWWFGYIREKGLKPGLWLNAYGDNYTNPSMADKYPEDYYLRNSAGYLSGACCTADTTVVRLDYTNPEVIKNHLKPLFETLVNDWGLSYLKSAGWGTWMDYYEENRENAYNPDMDSREAYRNAQAAIREAMGEDNYIVGCAMHEIGIGFGFFDGSRTGYDDFAHWTDSRRIGEGHISGGMQPFFNALFGANWLNGICWWSDPDAVMIRDPLNMEEARTIVSSISLSGQAYIISDFIADFTRERLQDFLHSDYKIGWAQQYPHKVKPLPEEKLQLYRKTMPAMPIRAMDLYPYRTEPTFCPMPETFPRALNLKVNAITGMYDVVALYNWEDECAVKSLDLQQDLGLEDETDYLVLDFWNKKLTRITGTTIQEEVYAHGTKVLIIKKVSAVPQLIATSRHLTSAYSIKDINWNTEARSLKGTSETIPGDLYTLYIHVPEDYVFETTYINAENVISTTHSDGMLEVSFIGQEEPAEWEILFN